ncbi:MAG: TIM barrel protein [Candidatus Helarchaeota archaeon]
MKKRLVFCSDHIKPGISLDDAIQYSIERNVHLEVHKVHFDDLFHLKNVSPIITIHPHWRDYSLGTNNSELLTNSLDYLKNLIDFINEKKIKYIIIHPEGYPFNLDKRIRSKIIIDSFKELTNYIEKYENCKILIENLPPGQIYPPSELPNYFIGEQLKDLKPILELNNKIEFIFDLGHFVCSYNTYGDQELEHLYDLTYKLTYVHVHDNNGKINNHEPLQRPESIEILRKIESRSRPLYSFEIRPNLSGLESSIRIVKNIINNQSS